MKVVTKLQGVEGRDIILSLEEKQELITYSVS